MSFRLDASLEAELASLAARGERRELEDSAASPCARGFDFASNDSLSLASHPAVIEAARDALARYGAGGRASRLLGGGSPLDVQAENAAADWLQTEAALLFASGYQANLGLVTALAGRGDVILSDERNHASLIDAARLSRAVVRVHRHLDLEHLDAVLRSSQGARRRLVLTESIFSMDGDAATLFALHELCERHDAWLAIDEAHAIGLIGAQGGGSWSAIDPRADIARSKASRLCARIVAGGKALGVGGAFVAGSRTLREHLVNRARSFIFTTAPSPAVAGALCAAIGVARGADAARERALGAARTVALALDLAEPAAAIVPWIAGSSERALAVARTLRESGLDVRAVRPPTVAQGTARLRIACHAHNEPAAVARLIDVLRAVGRSSARSNAGRASRGGRAIFVVGTDTDVGKTVVSAILVRAASLQGRAQYWKPVQTGPASDTHVVSELAHADCAAPLYAFALAASPHESAAAQGRHVDIDRLSAQLAALRASDTDATWIVELAGGLLVPYDDRSTQADWLAREARDLVLVARSGLGTLNHTLLTLEALDTRGLKPRALFLVGPRHASNHATLVRISGIEAVHEVPIFAELDTRSIDRWIAEHDLSVLVHA